jgi:hypothetical protein
LNAFEPLKRAKGNGVAHAISLRCIIYIELVCDPKRIDLLKPIMQTSSKTGTSKTLQDDRFRSQDRNQLKPGGYIYLSEPAALSYGMPIDEIQELMGAAGLIMESRKSNNRFFEGKFTRP